MASHKLTVKKLADYWEAYKRDCDDHTVVRTEFSQKESDFITKIIPNPITYTIKGFCIYIGMTETNFYETYNKNEKFKSVIARMKEECEIDARKKFEDGSIPTQLSGLWMSNYGYTTRQDQSLSVQPITVVNDLKE